MWSKDSRSTASSLRSLKAPSLHMNTPRVGLRDKLRTALTGKKTEETTVKSPVVAKALELRDRLGARKKPGLIPPLQRMTTASVRQ